MSASKTALEYRQARYRLSMAPHCPAELHGLQRPKHVLWLFKESVPTLMCHANFVFIKISMTHSHDVFLKVFAPRQALSSTHIVVIRVQSLSCVRLFATPWTAAYQASLAFTISQNLLKLMSIESVMLCNHLGLWRPLSHVRVFSNESVLGIRWPKDQSFSIYPHYGHLILPMPGGSGIVLLATGQKSLRF